MTVQVSLSAPPGHTKLYLRELIIPMVPRYSQLLLPGAATATCELPGYAWGMVAPGWRTRARRWPAARSGCPARPARRGTRVSPRTSQGCRARSARRGAAAAAQSRWRTGYQARSSPRTGRTPPSPRRSVNRSRLGRRCRSPGWNRGCWCPSGSPPRTRWRTRRTAQPPSASPPRSGPRSPGERCRSRRSGPRTRQSQC